jgi:NADPH:quinone reductase-like Zn-dependent oxidoreductase
MKAVVLTGAAKQYQLAIHECDRPAPGAGQVRVRLRASAVNRRDFWIVQGKYPDIKAPCILGSDGAGVIETVGPGVDPTCVGSEVVVYPVYAWGDNPRIPGPDFRILGMPDPGTFAEYICLPRANVYLKPPHLEMAQAAAMGLAGLTAWRALVTKAAVEPGETVLITGIGGGVATMALLWATALGARVIVTSSQDAKLKRARELGAADGYNHTRPDWHKELCRVHGGVDVVIDGNCGPLFQPCFGALKPAGRYIIFGFTLGQPAQGFDPARLFFRQLRIEGTTMATADEFKAMLAFATTHHLAPIIDKSFTLAEAAAALHYVGAGAQMGKVVLQHA